MIADGILIIRRSYPFDRTPVPAILNVHRPT
jgi:hypothetical protein